MKNTNQRTDKKIVDVACGGRMFWFDKKQAHTLFVDIREPETFTTGLGKHKRTRHISPDEIVDFRNLPYKDNEFYLVVFDPPHLSRLGDKSFTAKTYGKLNPLTWRDDLRKGFAECFRVLKLNGILIFKWCEFEIPLSEILKLTPNRPLFGHRSGKQQKTHWLAFMKLEEL